jgi:hypothetical protein
VFPFLLIKLKIRSTIQKAMDTKEFLTWLSPSERRAHELGALMLGTSYDPIKTHGYQKYLEAMRQKIEKQATETVVTTEKK